MNVEMNTIAQWASIISPLIAVIIAVWSGISSRKATTKQLSAIKESTEKQVNSIKELTSLQLQISRIQVDKELTNARYQYALIAEEVDNAKKINSSMLGTFHNEFTKEERARREKEMNLSSKEEYYSKQISLLKDSLQKLEAIGKEFNRK